MRLRPDHRPRTAADAVAVCEPLCVWLAGHYWAAGLERDDIIQEGRIGAWKAWKDWREDGGVPWHAFARLCIERQVITAIKTAQRGKHESLSTAVSYDAVRTEDGATLAEVIPLHSADTPTRVIDRERLQGLLHAVDVELSDVEHVAVLGAFVGLSYDEIAEHLTPDQLRAARHTKTVDNALQRAWKKLRLVA